MAALGRTRVSPGAEGEGLRRRALAGDHTPVVCEYPSITQKNKGDGLDRCVLVLEHLAMDKDDRRMGNDYSADAIDGKDIVIDDNAVVIDDSGVVIDDNAIAIDDSAIVIDDNAIAIDDSAAVIDDNGVARLRGEKSVGTCRDGNTV